MAKFGSYYKVGIFTLALVFLCSSNEGFALFSSDKDKVNQALDTARGLLKKGERAKAVEEIDRLRSLIKNRTELSRLTKARQLFLDQFLLSDSFQFFENAKAMFQSAQPADCLRELEQIKVQDEDNLQVRRQKAACLISGKQPEKAQKILDLILIVEPDDFEARVLQVEALVSTKSTKNLEDARLLAERIAASTSQETERMVLLRSKIYEAIGQPLAGAELLKSDLDKHSEHFEALFELAALYGRIAGQEQTAQRYIGLFLGRVRKLNLDEFKNRRLKALLPKAKDLYEGIEKRLAT